MLRKKSLISIIRKNGEIFSLTVPGLLYMLIFAYLPMLGLVLAFKNYRFDLGILGSAWVGLQNFKFFFNSEDAFRVTRNTILYELGYILLSTSMALLLAILMNELKKKYLRWYQTALFLPHFLSWVVISYITLAFLDQQNGFLNQFLSWFGVDPHSWYMEKEPWPVILNVVALWKRIGFAALIYYAGIIGIHPEYYEAARMDGATRVQLARHITLPMISPLIVILLILAIGGIFNGDFGLHYFIPNNSGMTYATTDIIDTYVYRALRDIGDIGMAAAVGLYQSVVGLILVLTANYIVKKMNPDHALW
ncbi:sugar ABC transporter permease [Paenibacillus psychroresistens]|uniref:Sugar ABC transporter permease n=2 Tax=Paenibacillus psychroresistens TaxID=1778678 RepID=A0A6B8RVU6_9BACL|nr:sugar ABC transporter permease [Paenibacillus psychroresistens]